MSNSTEQREHLRAIVDRLFKQEPGFLGWLDHHRIRDEMRSAEWLEGFAAKYFLKEFLAGRAEAMRPFLQLVDELAVLRTIPEGNVPGERFALSADVERDKLGIREDLKPYLPPNLLNGWTEYWRKENDPSQYDYGLH